eukprot:SAG31_NODE_2331_length_5931_cov_4.533093_3_plen_147_part_00
MAGISQEHACGPDPGRRRRDFEITWKFSKPPPPPPPRPRPGGLAIENGAAAAGAGGEQAAQFAFPQTTISPSSRPPEHHLLRLQGQHLPQGHQATISPCRPQGHHLLRLQPSRPPATSAELAPAGSELRGGQCQVSNRPLLARKRA